MKDSLTILHLASSYFPRIGGASVRMHSLLSPIAAEGRHTLHMLVSQHDRHGTPAYEQPVSEYEVVDGIHVHRVEKYRSLVPYGLELIRNEGIDVIHSHNLGLASLGALLGIGRRAHVVEVHTIRPKPMWRLVLEKSVLCGTKNIIVLSSQASRWLQSRFHIADNRITLIRNGYSPERFTGLENKQTVLSRLGLPQSGGSIIGYIGSFYDFQGVMSFVQMARCLLGQRSDVRFLMIGGGPELPAVKDYIAAHGMGDRVWLHEWIRPEQVPSHLNAIDIFAIPRPRMIETDTALPLKVIEAMVLGKPILATRVGGLQEILRDRENGLLVEPTVDALVEGANLLLDDSLLASEIGSRAAQAIADLTWQNQSRKLLNLYDSLL